MMMIFVSLECDPPSVVSNAVVNGNRRLVGSKIQYKCTANTSIAFISVCLDTGKWSTVPDCPPVGKNKSHRLHAPQKYCKIIIQS